jgi:predicted O-methyltransferase YrrM
MSVMIPNLEEYFREFVPTRDATLLALEEEARQQEIPIIGPVVGELLYVLALASQARQILELGTATGYSAIYLARACEVSEGRVVTLERDESMARRAKANFQEAGVEHRIEIIVGDALQEMAKMSGPFDFIFMDIDKENYFHALPYCQKLLRSGGLLVADNVGFEGADSFNQAVADHPEWRTVHLLCLLPLHSPEQDGLCLALRV